jgi:small multidrug resistance pump
MDPPPAVMISFLQSATIGLILMAASGYSVAKIGLKMGATALNGAAVLVIALGLGAAVVGELTALRNANLGPIYIAIIGTESLIVMLYAWFIGEPLSTRQIGGAGMVVAGLILVNQ